MMFLFRSLARNAPDEVTVRLPAVNVTVTVRWPNAGATPHVPVFAPPRVPVPPAVWRPGRAACGSWQSAQVTWRLAPEFHGDASADSPGSWMPAESDIGCPGEERATYAPLHAA